MSNSFYLFRQNNSGGKFVVNDKLCKLVMIEASSLAKAEKEAEDLGIYYYGVSLGQDCECCGDRWVKPDVLKFPMTYRGVVMNTPEDYAQHLVNMGSFSWTIPDSRIFYKPGFVENSGTGARIFYKNGSVSVVYWEENNE